MDKFLIFVGGIAVGAVSSYLVLATYFEEKAAEEEKMLRSFYEKKLEAASAAATSEETQAENEQEEVAETTSIERPPADTGAIMDGHRSIDGYYNYSAVYQRSNVGMPSADDTHPDDDDNDAPPRPISPTEMAKHIAYAQIMLQYYTEDGVLADEKGNVYDIPTTIGPDGLKSIGKYEADTGYVTDEGIRVDYVIERIDNSYEDAFVFS